MTIADALVQHQSAQSINPALSGAPGVALALAYAGEMLPDRGYGEAAHTILDGAIDAIDELATPSLWSGFCGLAWVVEHLARDGDEDANAEVDEILCELVASGPWPGHFDLVSGLVGNGIYALERGARSTSRELLGHIVDRVAELSERTPDGIAVATPERFRRIETGGTSIAPPYNLGLAHGLAGAVSFLATAAATERQPVATELLPELVRFLISRGQLHDGSGVGFNCGEAAPSARARTAWCYGDPGNAIALLVASEVTGNSAWREAALTAALREAARPRAETNVVDAGLCHGSAGVMHLFNVLHQALGAEPLERAACTWLDDALGMARDGEGIGGYLAHDGAARGWLVDASFLTGAAGIALALMATISEQPPDWDRLLLVSGVAS